MLCGSHIKIWNLVNHMKIQNKKHQNARFIDEKLKTKSLMGPEKKSHFNLVWDSKFKSNQCVCYQKNQFSHVKKNAKWQSQEPRIVIWQENSCHHDFQKKPSLYLSYITDCQMAVSMFEILTANIFESGPMPTPWKILDSLPVIPSC